MFLAFTLYNHLCFYIIYVMGRCGLSLFHPSTAHHHLSCVAHLIPWPIMALVGDTTIYNPPAFVARNNTHHV
jgi:hypothetical protein